LRRASVYIIINVYGAVPFAPVNVIFGEAAPIQTFAAPAEIVAVGGAMTVTVALPEAVCEQPCVVASLTETSSYRNGPVLFVGAATVTELPLVVVTILLAPPFIR
jgi:hypothetical protein